MFKNLYLFRFLKPFTLSPDELHQKLAEQAFRPCGTLDLYSMGWIPPISEEANYYTHSVSDCIIFTARRQEKILPASVIREHLNEKVKEIEEKEHRKLSKKEKNVLKDEVLQTLIPRAFSRTSHLSAYIDSQRGWLIVDTGSEKKAQEFSNLLRHSIDTLPIIIPQMHRSPALVMTEWLSEHNYPTDFKIEDACQMMDSEQATVNCKRQDLLTEEIHAHLDAGKQVKRLALQWEERLAMVLDDALIIRNLRFLNESAEGDAHTEEKESYAQRFDSEFTLMTLELRQFIPRLFEVFGGENEESYQRL
ncbi:recombination-associated protein RdgC [Beggiatoa leptomitoformis]|uniref:Recombination-associated protein RdgC n=1 Tax=Beggiatoa leptomitoformis TaxID=288004 RepID=A0A2N9YE48_9GAMM|nr:recombination-associated protein RdgC [Beggiatoa leptomitoformis]ALG68864.1 recombination-associated protein RdgC [Beggiatoa leptomitoformis]AUI68767.1 recombination-associated protein RdgC [Beggiatoa leptomitoformis]